MTTPHPAPAYLQAHLTQLASTPSGHGTFTLVAVALIALAVGTATGIGVHTMLSPKPLVHNLSHTLPGQQPQVPPVHGHPDPAAGQRTALITAMLTVRGLIEDPQAADVIDESLRTAGVTVFDPTGHPKDPRYHRVRHTEPAPDQGKAGTIARTLSPGYIDAGRVLQPADVVVYT
jgi:hypothetical protein